MALYKQKFDWELDGKVAAGSFQGLLTGSSRRMNTLLVYVWSECRDHIAYTRKYTSLKLFSFFETKIETYYTGTARSNSRKTVHIFCEYSFFCEELTFLDNHCTVKTFSCFSEILKRSELFHSDWKQKSARTMRSCTAPSSSFLVFQ